MDDRSINIDTYFFRKLAEGSEAALEKISHLYKADLMGCIFQIVHDSELAEEIFWDTIRALWEHRTEVGTMDRPVGWMITTARNKSINTIRQLRKNNTVPLTGVEEDAGTYDILPQLEAMELQRCIVLAEQKLTPQERVVYNMSRKEGLSRKEIAERCSVSENTVRNQLKSAVKSIRASIAKFLRPFFV